VVGFRFPIGDDFLATDDAPDAQTLRIRRTAAKASVVRGVTFLETFFSHAPDAKTGLQKWLGAHELCVMKSFLPSKAADVSTPWPARCTVSFKYFYGGVFMRMLKRIFPVLALFAVLVATSGCASMKRSMARSRFIEEKTKGYVYKKSVDDIFPVAWELLFERGYEAQDTFGKNNFVMQTRPKFDDSNNRSSYFVKGMRIDEKKSKLEFSKKSASYNSQTGGYYDSSPSRDLALEFELIKRLDPEQAALIESEATAAAEQEVPTT